MGSHFHKFVDTIDGLFLYFKFEKMSSPGIKGVYSSYRSDSEGLVGQFFYLLHFCLVIFWTNATEQI